MDIRIPLVDEEGNTIPNALKEVIALPERALDRSALELLEGNTRNRIFELMVGYILHDLAQNPTNTMKKAKKSMRGITFNHKFTEMNTEKYKFSNDAWRRALLNFQNKIENMTLYSDDGGENVLLKKFKVVRDGEEFEQRKQQFQINVEDGDKFYLRSKMNITSSDSGVPSLDNMSIKELIENRSELVGYSYDRGTMRLPYGPQVEKPALSREDEESRQVEMMNFFMTESPLIDEDILRQSISVTRKGNSNAPTMVVTVNSYEYWNKMFEKYGFGKLKDLKSTTVTDKETNEKTRRIRRTKIEGKPRLQYVASNEQNEDGTPKRKIETKREELMAYETQRMEDPESGFFDVYYVQNPKKGQDGKESYRGAKATDFTVSDPRTHSLTIMGDKASSEIRTTGLFAERETYDLPTDEPDSSYDDLKKIINYLNSLKQSENFKEAFISNTIRKTTGDFGERDESGYILSKPEHHYEIQEYLVPKDMTLDLGVLIFEYSLNYEMSLGNVTKNLTDPLTFKNLFTQGTTSRTKVRSKQIKDQEKVEANKNRELLEDITSDNESVNFDKPSIKFYEYMIDEKFVDETEPGEIEERLEEASDYQYSQVFDSDIDEELEEEQRQVTDINPSELEGDYRAGSRELDNIMEEGQESDNAEDETTPRLVDMSDTAYITDEVFQNYIQDYPDEAPEQYVRKIKIIKQRFWNRFKHLLETAPYEADFEQTGRVVAIRIDKQIKQDIAVVKAIPSGELQRDIGSTSRFTQQRTKTRGRVTLQQKNQTLLLTLNKSLKTLKSLIDKIGNRRGD